MTVDGLVIGDLLLASAAGAALMYGALVAAGFAPRDDGAATPVGMRLVAWLASGLTGVLAVALAGFIVLATAWAPALIAAGLGLLGGPLIFQAAPARLNNGAAGLAAAVVVAGALGYVLGVRAIEAAQLIGYI